MQNRLSQLEEFINNHDQAGVAAWCEQLCYWFDPGGWFDIMDFGKWLGDKASVTEEDEFDIEYKIAMNNPNHAI